MILELMMVIAIDGDTLKYNGERIRMHGIDAPELSQTCDEGVTLCGKIARDHLTELVQGGVKCIQTDYDAKWKRPVAQCTNTAGIDVNKAMVVQGWALAYRKYSTDYVADEESAARQHFGMWAGTFIKPWDWRGGARWTNQEHKRLNLAAQKATMQSPTQSFVCEPRETCSGGISCERAKWALTNCGWGSKLDRDSDGHACDIQCGD